MMVLRTLERQPLHGYTLGRTSSDLLQIEEHLEGKCRVSGERSKELRESWGRVNHELAEATDLAAKALWRTLGRDSGTLGGKDRGAGCERRVQEGSRS